MNINNIILDAIKKGDLPEIQAVLIGCLDDDENSFKKSKTLAFADEISKKLPEHLRLFEEDNGYFDFKTAMKDFDTFANIKARLRINFSREKLAFACEILDFLNVSAQTDSEASLAAAESIEEITTESVVQSETPLVPEVVIASPAESLEGSKNISEEPSIKTQELEVIKLDSDSQMQKKLEDPEAPSAPEPARPSSFSSSASKTKSLQQQSPSRPQESSKQQFVSKISRRQPGSCESKLTEFGRVVGGTVCGTIGRGVDTIADITKPICIAIIRKISQRR